MSNFRRIAIILFISFLSGAATASAMTNGPKVEGQRYTMADLTPKTISVTAVQDDNGLWGFVDQSGKEKIKPKYEAIGKPQKYKTHALGLNYDIDQGVIPVKLNGKWGFVNHAGKEIVKPQFDWVGQFKTEKKQSGFNEGDTEGTCMVVNGSRAFIINSKGKEIRDAGYSGIEVIEGTIFTKTTNGIKIIESDGSWTDISPANGGYILRNKNNNTAVLYNTGNKKSYTIVGSYWIMDEAGDIRCVDANGLPDMSRPGLHDVEPFTDNLVIGTINGKKGIYTKDLKEILAPKYDSLAGLSPELFAVAINGRYGVVNIQGQEIIAPKYDSISQLGSDLFLIKSNEKYGLIDSDGTIILQPEYQDIEAKGVFLLVTQNNNKGIYDTLNKKILLDCKYQDIDFRYGSNSSAWLAAVKKNGLWGIMNQTGEEIIPCEYKRLSSFETYTTAYKPDGSVALINEWPGSGNAKVLIPAGVFTNIYNFSNGNYYILYSEKNDSRGAFFPASGKYVAPKYKHVDAIYNNRVFMWNGAYSPARGTITVYDLKGNVVATANVQTHAQMEALVKKMLYN